MSTKQLVRGKDQLQALTDEALLILINDKNTAALEFLLRKYKCFVLSKASTYYLIGGDKEDIIQEGMIGLYKAICDYDGEELTSFRGFADLCITRQIITAIKTASRQKHIPLNSYVSLDKPVYHEDSERTLLDTIAETTISDPQVILDNQEHVISIEVKLSELLSSLERRVFRLYLDGFSYEEISDRLNRHVKSIDNALQRIKKKLGHLVTTHEFQL